MAHSSIYDDLKRFKGPINKSTAIRDDNMPKESPTDDIAITAANTIVSTDAVMSTTNTRIQKPAKNSPAPAAEVNINDVLRHIKPPLYVVYDNNGIVYDTSTLAVRCYRGHLHKYFINDIIKGIQCITCSSGTIFSNTVRKIAEDLLRVPFVIDEINKKMGYITYSNPVLKIKLVCNRIVGTNSSYSDSGYIVISIHRTLSAERIKMALYSYLHDYAPLTSKQRENILEIKIMDDKKYIKSYIPDRPPVSKALASLNNVLDGSLICDDKLLFMENC